MDNGSKSIFNFVTAILVIAFVIVPVIVCGGYIALSYNLARTEKVSLKTISIIEKKSRISIRRSYRTYNIVTENETFSTSSSNYKELQEGDTCDVEIVEPRTALSIPYIKNTIHCTKK